MFDRVEVLMELADTLLVLGLPAPYVGERFHFEEVRWRMRPRPGGRMRMTGANAEIENSVNKSLPCLSEVKCRRS